MTVVLPAPPAETPSAEAEPVEDAAPQTSASTGARRPASPTLTGLAAGLSAAAGAWMVGGLFRGVEAHFVALIGVAVGTVAVVMSHRLRHATWLQWIATPAALLVGTVLTVPSLSGGDTLARAVTDALRAGGLLQPPVSFDPGWRLILVVLLALVATGSASLAIGLQRPRLGVVLPMPLTFAAAVIQPDTSQLVSAAVAVVFIVAALSFAYGAELGRDGQVAGAFELRRIARSGVVAGALIGAITAINSLGILFPQPNRSHVVPPQRPPVSPPLSDRVLASYTSPTALPLRLGVIDIYDQSQNAWLLPPFDAGRLQRIEGSLAIPGAPLPAGKAQTVRVSIGDLQGHALPTLAGTVQVRELGEALLYDPRTEALSLADRPVTAGLHYTLVLQPVPTSKDLAAAGVAGSDLAPYLSVPPPPNEVVVALRSCALAATRLHAGDDPFDRLQCVRQQLYSQVVVAGPGVPADVSPARVADMLHGAEATPYEISAAEALLARWAGVPSRIGYGYYGGDRQPDGSLQVHPRHGATWLEGYFGKLGWVPILGQPPRAAASTNPSDKNNIPALQTDRLQLILYIPVQRPSLQLLYETVRYIVLSVLPLILLAALLVGSYPWAVKRFRARRRRRWAHHHGLEGRIAVAYSELRDRARDLTVGGAGASPVAFLDHVAPDAEHEELAWLVSRALWGDLRRDLRPDEATAAERLSRSVAARLDRAQPIVTRILARTSRASLREPYSEQVPNLWWELGVRRLLAAALALPRRLRRRGRRRRLAIAAGIAGILVVLTGCGGPAPPARTLPSALVPKQLSGITFVRQNAAEAIYRSAGTDALVSDGQVYTVVAGQVTYGDVQVELFKPRVTVDDMNDESMTLLCLDSTDQCPGHQIFRGIQADFPGGHFHRLYYHDQRVYELALSDQTIFLWFPPHTETMVMLVLLNRFGSSTSTALMSALVDFENRRAPATVPMPSPAPAASPSPSVSPGAAS